MNLKDLPADARPRERALALGMASLTDAELLALQLGTGTAGVGVMQLATQLLQRLGGLAGLLQARDADLQGIKGMGPARKAELAAMAEILRRALVQQVQQQPVLDASPAVRAYLQLHMGKLAHEEFAVVFLNAQHRLIRMKTLFRGTLTQTAVYPREVVRESLACHAASVIVAHNHPSGVAEPSMQDQRLTTALREALALVDVRLLDHIVVGQGQTVSFAERGLL
jgi:DNA repair protein RadC